MPKLDPVNDSAVYRKTADDAYAKRMADGVVNPRRVTAARMADSGADSPNPPTPAAMTPATDSGTGMSQADYAKGAGPQTAQQKAAQQAALAKVLAARDKAQASEEK